MKGLTEQEIAKLPADTKAIVTAVLMAQSLGQHMTVDDLLKDIRARNVSPMDVLYVDLSIDRSKNPERITGAGTFIIAADASDDQAVLTIGFPGTESDANKRISLKNGKRIFLPYTEFFIYHDAQAGKSMKLMRGREVSAIKVGIEDDSKVGSSGDISTALGNSSTFTTAQVTIPATAGGIIIAAANTARRRLTIQNTDLGTGFYIRKSNAVSTTTGHYIPPGGGIVLNTTEAVYGIVAAGTIVVTTLEE